MIIKTKFFKVEDIEAMNAEDVKKLVLELYYTNNKFAIAQQIDGDKPIDDPYIPMCAIRKYMLY